MQFVTIPLPLALLVLAVLAVSFVWSFRLAKKLDKAYDDYDSLWKEVQDDLLKKSVQYNWKTKS
jgi:hypothetical protein